jgi:hypothetical protein
MDTEVLYADPPPPALVLVLIYNRMSGGNEYIMYNICSLGKKEEEVSVRVCVGGSTQGR